MDLHSLRYLVVGAGLWGGVLAERIASQLGERVLVIDRRPHAGGNCHSYRDAATGIECHAYGSHIFHTSIPRVWEYVTQFTEFTTYRHKVFTQYQGRVYPMPINLLTINNFYNLNLKPYEVEEFIKKEAGKAGDAPPRNLEEKAVSLIGRPLYEAFIKGYTQKQWEKAPRDLPAEIIARLPVRGNYVTDYFADPWQGMPKNGYAAFFERLFSHPLIEVVCNTEYADIAGRTSGNCFTLYSGPLDAFFGYARGHLEWRSLTFEREVVPYGDYQGTAVMNNADPATPYTRVHEFKHLHPERGPQSDASVIAREYPKTFTRGDEAYYPVNTPENEELLHAYQADLAARPGIIAGGRLGAYKYMDMDKTIAAALECFDGIRKGSGHALSLE
jgi:UDP-galactopyranose mutase